MNNPLVRWLLNIESIPADAEGVRLAWENPWPAWVWAVLLVFAAAFAMWSYSRLIGRQAGRLALAGVRAAVLLLVLVLISGPMLQMPRETIEQDWVLALVDRSASMQIPDVERADGRGRMTRDEQVREILRANEAVFAQLGEERQLLWLGFHMGAFNLGTRNSELPVDLGPAEGPRTNLSAALEQAVQRAAGRPLSGVVLLSDGRTNDAPSRALLRRLQGDAVPVYVVPLGSPEPFAEMAIRRVDAPRRAFVRDKVPVTVRLDALGESTDVGDMSATVRLIDEMTGEELDRVEMARGEAREAVTLTAEPEMAGRTSWRIEIETERPALVPENTVHSFAIELIDRPLRVLFVEGYPRWEYRYVKNLTVREDSIESSVMLISADRDFAQEGNQPITRLPRSPEEFAEFDVIVLGDVPASFFTPQQLDMIRDHVAERGAGLLWIAGERDTPGSYAGTVLADLLPMRLAGVGGVGGAGRAAVQPIGRPVLMRPTELAERLGVLRLATHEGVGWPRELLDESYGWSRLHWAVRLDPVRLKPAAEVLAETTESIQGEFLPLVTLMRYGAGQTIFVATDEIWRWRYGRGELLPEQFWVQMMRLLGRESLEVAGLRAALDVSPRRAQVGQPIRVEMRLFDARLAEERRASVPVILENEHGETVAEINLLSDGAGDRFAATYLPDAPGDYRVRVPDPSPEMAGAAMEGTVEVYAPDDELRRPETDHALLEQLAAATGGRVLGPDDLGELRNLPNRSIRTDNPLTERIWDTPLFFILILLALTAEWIGRKMLRLV